MEEGHPAQGPVRFGEFEVDFRAGELRKRDLKIRLQKQPFQILEILLARAGEVVSREELQQRIWPADTFVDFDQGLSNAIKRLRGALCDSAESPRFIETIPRRGYRFMGIVENCVASRMQSLAVLPLENLSGDPEQEYFADGLTEALITNLAKISALHVVSRTSVMQYKGVHRPLREIARELGVDAVVEGTVRRVGMRVCISAQLVDARVDRHLWAESYERDLRDILVLQADVAGAIAQEVRAKLTPQEQANLTRTRPVDPEAYEAYLKGRYYWNRRTPEGVRRGYQYFQQAIEKDPTYAAAYAGLADFAGVAGWWGFVPPEQGCGRAKQAARKSLDIEETAEAHASLGWGIIHYDFDVVAAEREFQTAVRLDPRYAIARQWYAHFLGYMGRWDECLREATRAVQLDPLCLIFRVTHSAIFWFKHQNSLAAEHCLRALELDPNFIPLRWMLANAYENEEMHEQAIDERRWAVEHSGGASVFLAELAASCAAAGKRDESIQILVQLDGISKTQYVPAYYRALVYAALKEPDETFHWLDTAYRERSARLTFLKIDPRLQFLRSDPRFQDLLRRMNFPP